MMVAASYHPLTDALQAALREAYEGSAKRLARAADVSPGTARNWIDGTCQPRLEHILRLAQDSDAVAAALVDLAGPRVTAQAAAQIDQMTPADLAQLSARIARRLAELAGSISGVAA